MSSTPTVAYLGMKFHSASPDAAAAEILGQTAGPFRYVVTPNVHHMVMINDKPAIKGSYDNAWRVYCDSRILARMAKLQGTHLSVITGSDLTADLVAKAALQQLRVAIIGPTPADAAALRRRYPGLNFVLHTPPMGFIASEDEVQRCIDFVVKTAAPLTFLAVGAPQQEALARRIAEHPQARGIGLCIGASIDFLTGKQQRAPLWVQRAGLEWLHRLMSNPKRLARRYLVECPRIFLLAATQARRSATN